MKRSLKESFTDPACSRGTEDQAVAFYNNCYDNQQGHCPYIEGVISAVENRERYLVPKASRRELYHAEETQPKWRSMKNLK